MLVGFVLIACQNKPGNQGKANISGAEKVTVDTVSRSAGTITDTVYRSENLIIRKLSDHTFQHISYLNTEDFGKVDCNGMIVTGNNEAVVFDTPADTQSSRELIRYLSEAMNYTIKAVVATHFHGDCVAGLAQFHEARIPSYANNSTIALLKKKDASAVIPQSGFDGSLELNVGGQPVSAEFFGEGHTKDNIIGYYPEENVLFGGCLIKEAGAGKGNLEDANEAAWAETVKKIKNKYPNAAIVIPGHGKPGGTELLDYTIRLFAR